jgi:hypothetical protein
MIYWNDKSVAHKNKSFDLQGYLHASFLTFKGISRYFINILKTQMYVFCYKWFPASKQD